MRMKALFSKYDIVSLFIRAGIYTLTVKIPASHIRVPGFILRSSFQLLHPASCLFRSQKAVGLAPASYDPCRRPGVSLPGVSSWLPASLRPALAIRVIWGVNQQMGTLPFSLPLKLFKKNILLIGMIRVDTEAL